MPDRQDIIDAFALKAKATLAPFGIALENPCDLSLLKDKITELTEDFLKEANEAVNALSAEAVSAQFWPIVAQVLIEVFGVAEGMATAYVDKIVGDLMNKGMGIVYSLVAVLLTSLDSGRLVLDYLSVVALKKALEKRIEMNRVIEIDIRILISFIKNLQKVIDIKKAKAGHYGSLVLAKSRLNVVLQILNTEISKLENRANYAVAKIAIDRAVLGIKETLDDLTQGAYNASTKLLNKAAKAASEKLLKDNKGELTQELLEIVKIDDLIKIINKNIKDIIFDDISRKNANASDYDSALKAQMNVFNLYLSKVFPLIPDTLQLILAQELVGSSVNRLVKRMPILGGLSAEVTKKATEWLSEPSKQLQKVFPITPSILNEPPILKTEPNLTWKRAMTAGKLAKSSVLLTPDYFAFLQTVGYLAEVYLKPARSVVQDVQDDIQDAITDLDNRTTDLFSIQLRKAKWTSSLITAKGMLESLTPTITFENGLSIDIASALELQQISDTLLSEIKLKIQEFSYNAVSGEAIIEPGDRVHYLAQEYLLPLMASQVVLFNPKISARVLPGLIAIKTLLGQQHLQDLEILKLCNRYISTMDASPTFRLAKAEFDAIFNSVGAVDVIIEQIRAGNLSGIVGLLDRSNLLSDISNMALCFGKELKLDGVESLKVGIWDALSDTWGSAKEFLDWEKERGKMVNDLKDKLADLKDLVHIADLIISQFTNALKTKIEDFTEVN